MRVTFILPAEAFKLFPPTPPICFAILSSLTPPDIEVKFYDDRLENIPYDEKADVVGISVNTPTAKRAYEIAGEYRKRGVLVILGGVHPTLVPEEAIEYCDCVVMGEAEELWLQIVKDVQKRCLKRFYFSSQRPSLEGLRPDREIFKNKKYLPIIPVEFGRGCRHKCNFCVPAVFYNHTYNYRPIKDVIAEVETLAKNRPKQFTDDNLTAEPNIAKKLFKELIPLKTKWRAQTNIHVAADEELLDLMSESGCELLCFGFESLETKNLIQMDKLHNLHDYRYLVKKIRDRGISLMGTFIFGYDYDDKKLLEDTLEFTIRNKFYHVILSLLSPWPKTSIYNKLQSEGRLFSDKWWLEEGNEHFHFNFRLNDSMTTEELEKKLIQFSSQFYSLFSILRRFDFKTNCKNVSVLCYFLLSNLFCGINLNRIKKKSGYLKNHC